MYRLSRVVRQVGLGMFSAFLLAGALVYLLATAIGVVLSVSLLADWRAWHFPGDPPLAELGVEADFVAFVAATLSGLLLFSVGFFSSTRVRAGFAVSAGLLVAIASVPLICVAQRHVGEWSRFRSLAWEYVHEARAHGLEGRQFDQPPEFRFARWSEPVRLRAISSKRWPTALVDFGNGGTAEFDLRTMWCTYSD